MGEITGLRINFLIEVHGDGDAPSLYTQNENSDGEIAGLRINFLIEVHRDGDTPSLYTQ